jgi:glutamine amidotransferase
MIVYVDTRVGNLGSLLRAFNLLGISPKAVECPDDVQTAQAIILPGVGSFGDGMASLRSQGLIEPLRVAASQGRPLFGICLGMQLLFDESEEHGRQEGLGLIHGRVRRLDPKNDSRYRVPNIGWCDIATTKPNRLFSNNNRQACCYFVHSYHADPADSDVVTAAIDYAGQTIPVAVEIGNLFGVQFHPEKSQDDGLAVLAAFCDHLRREGRLAA